MMLVRFSFYGFGFFLTVICGLHDLNILISEELSVCDENHIGRFYIAL